MARRSHQLVVKGGRVALDDGWRDCDVGIDDGRIAAIDSGLQGGQTIDAAGLWVMPGGIDAHCHLDQPVWGGAGNADDFESGSISAAFGGTTCIVPFGMPGPNMTTVDALERAMGCAAGRSIIDYGLHAVVTMGTGANVEAQLNQLAGQGIASVKLFMTYQGFAVDDDLFFTVLDTARKLGWIVMVHAENDAAIRRTRQRLIELGRTEMRYHAVAHSEIMEREATHRALALAEMTGTRMTIVHVSSRQSAEEVARARQRGVDVAAETCPQYIF
ncbi:MAG: dihydropyrimidinase, partial [Mesorhizobium sp.]